MSTGENAEALRKIIDWIRKCSIVVLCLHFYVYCYSAFELWGWTHHVIRDLLYRFSGTGLFSHFYTSKVVALGLLFVSLIGTKGRKDEKIRLPVAVRHLVIGLVLYLGSYLFLKLSSTADIVAGLYMAVTSMGFLMVLNGGVLLTRIMKQRLDTDIFNQLQETFPQEERLLENEYSINLPARYNLKGKIRKSFINIINPFRALLVAGTPGS